MSYLPLALPLATGRICTAIPSSVTVGQSFQTVKARSSGTHRLCTTSVSDFITTTLWQPRGAERDTTRSLDSERSGFERMESGFNATAVDDARFGLLFLHDAC